MENQEFRTAINEMNRQNIQPVRETQLIPGLGINGAGALDPATLGATGNLDNFIVSFHRLTISVLRLIIQKTAPPSKTRGQDNKAARIPQNELLDMIQDCFKEYRYWGLKTLRDKLRQPESYLRQTLELVAQQVRQGPQANTWQLKKEFRNIAVDTADEPGPLDSTDMPGRTPVAGEAGGGIDSGVGQVKIERRTPQADLQ